MKILHTSDWHLGRALYGRKRYEEFEAFLDWLAGTIRENAVDVLLIAGDIFDTSAPSNRAQALYYRFLCRVAASSCRHVVVVAGNHDSPSFLNAPRELLKALNVHVVGNACENPEDEVLLLDDETDRAQLMVCAVPYLRDRDIRTAEAGESLEDKERKLTDGIRSHYARVAQAAEQKRTELGAHIPIIATGHLFTAGGKTTDGDGVRDLYVGSLARVTAGIFPATFDYLALGHLHVPQKVGGSETRRYSGAPLAMGFGEARQQKSVCLVKFPGHEPHVSLVDVPVFQRLERLSGNWDNISARISELAAGQAQAWLEIVYDGAEIMGDLRQRLDAAIDGTNLEILRIKNNRVTGQVLEQMRQEETLDDMDVHEVFERCLDSHEIPPGQRPGLIFAYRELVSGILESDVRAE